jgi:hypothetical protein
VVCPGRSISKCSIAEFTLEGALSCVDTHVTLKGLFLGAAAPTYGTENWFAPMESHVLLQALHAHKAVLTHRTLKILFGDMHGHMTLDKQTSQMIAMSPIII